MGRYAVVQYARICVVHTHTHTYYTNTVNHFVTDQICRVWSLFTKLHDDNVFCHCPCLCSRIHQNVNRKNLLLLFNISLRLTIYIYNLATTMTSQIVNIHFATCAKHPSNPTPFLCSFSKCQVAHRISIALIFRPFHITYITHIHVVQ